MIHESNRVFVLGAGASRHAGYPLTSQLLQDLLKWTASKADSNPNFARTNEVLSEYSDLYGPDLEEILDQIVRGVAQADQFGNIALKVRLAGTLRDLTEAIRMLFEEIRSASGPASYLIFAEQACREGDTVITFNYDTQVEAALKVAGKWEVGDGYGFSVMPDGELPKSKLHVLKLHGSVSWWAVLFGGRTRGFFTSSGGSLGDRPVIPECEMKALGYSSSVRDPKCPDKSARLITLISPVRGKRFYFETSDGREYEEFFDHLWGNAAQALRGADELFILGYSMPDADDRARDLLLRATNRSARVVVAAGSASERIAHAFRSTGYSDITTLPDRRFEAWDWKQPRHRVTESNPEVF